MTVPSFVAIEAELAVPTLLTPRVTRWSEHVWLLDLTACRTYWRSQAAVRQSEPRALIQDVLRRVVGDRLRAVLAEHAWRALTTLAQMRDRDLSGIIDLGGTFGRSFYRQISWAAWLGCAEEFGERCAAVKVPRFCLAAFRHQLALMTSAMARLKQPTPWSFSTAAPASIRRRFGATLALLWGWSFPRDVEASAFASGFPWVPWVPAEVPSVARHLDDPLWQWDQLAPLLVEDFDRLCRLPGVDPSERVTAVTWCLTLDDLATLAVPIRFRHPHRLDRELGHHKTAVAQAGFAFDAAKHQIATPDGVKPIAGWTLRIDERLVLAKVVADLFGEVGESDESRVAEIENQLPVPIERYMLRDDWLPEASFGPGAAEQPPAAWQIWLDVARLRPFYLEAPRPLATGGRSLGRVFLERVGGHWWMTPDAPDCRDYYRVIDRGQWIWAYRDRTGRWWRHGRFD